MNFRRIGLTVGFLILTFCSSGCLNGVITLIVHADGSVTYIEDMVIDRLMLDLVATAKDTSSPPLLFGQKRKAPIWDKLRADAMRELLFADPMKQRKAMSFVKSVTGLDTPTYSGLHYILTTELTSYHFIDSIVASPSTDTAAKKGHQKKMKKAKPIEKLSQPIISESGDSVKITLHDSFDRLNDFMKSLPERSRPPMFQKLKYSRRRSQMISNTLFHPAGMQQVGDDDSSGAGHMMDSLGKMMGMFTGMMSDMFSLEYNVQVPQALSHDSSAEVDSVNNMLHWHVDLSTMFTGGASAEEKYVWFRKPR